MPTEVRIFTVSASSQANEECRGHVVVSGSYGGEYNAFHAGKWGIRGVVLNDAGIGKDRAGVRGLDYLDTVGLAAATADAMTCHIADGDHMLAHGTISHVNKAAAALGCAVGQSVHDCAELMKAGSPATGELPPIKGGKRYTMREEPGEPKVICLDAAPMLEQSDAGAIAVTGSHAALFRGQPCMRSSSATAVSGSTMPACAACPNSTSAAFRPAPSRPRAGLSAMRAASIGTACSRMSTPRRRRWGPGPAKGCMISSKSC
jgi:hypothetical protein